MKISIKRIGKLPTFGGDSGINIAINQAHRLSGDYIKKDLHKALTTGQKSGRYYWISSDGKATQYHRKGGGKWHHASAAGEIPAKITGGLADSAGFSVENKSLVIGVTKDYGADLEQGTARIAARPFVKPVVEENLEQVVRFMAEQLKIRVFDK